MLQLPPRQSGSGFDPPRASSQGCAQHIPPAIDRSNELQAPAPGPGKALTSSRRLDRDYLPKKGA